MKKVLITKEQAIADGNNEKIMIYCSQTNPFQFNIHKAIEESTEFTEVLVKSLTKHPDNRPDPANAVKEFGDLVYRGTIALLTLFPDMTLEQVTDVWMEHMANKLDKLRVYLQEGKYTGGL